MLEPVRHSCPEAVFIILLHVNNRQRFQLQLYDSCDSIALIKDVLPHTYLVYYLESAQHFIFWIT